MEQLSRLLIIQESIDIKSLQMICVLLGMLAIASAVFIWIARDSYIEGEKKLAIILGVTLTVGSIIGVGILSPMTNSYIEEVKTLKSSFYGNLEKQELQTEQILNVAYTEDYFCQQAEISNKERCAYVEFMFNGGKRQVFIPLKEELSLDKGVKTTITYLAVSEDERDLLNEYMDMEKVKIGDVFWIIQRTWLIGDTIRQEIK